MRAEHRIQVPLLLLQPRGALEGARAHGAALLSLPRGSLLLTTRPGPHPLARRLPPPPLLQELEGRWTYVDSWQETYLRGAAAGYAAGSKRPRRVAGFYSDLLSQPWLYSAVDLDPAWLEVDNIDRRSGLTPAQFREQYESCNRPVIITDAVRGAGGLRV